MMKRILFALALSASSAAAQGTLKLTVRVDAEGGPLERAIVRVDSAGALTNSTGTAQLRVRAGQRLVRITALGYAPDSVRLTLVAGRDTAIAVTLEPTAAALSGVIVTTTRGAKRIEEEPTRVEVLAGDDVAEKTEMRPADLTKFLTEMPGVQVQTTAAASGAAGVRLQGLRPRYTLLLADGLPLYGGTGGAGLDLMQMPPADLKQVEVVKGPASALYGASALAGTINLVSKRPGHEADLLLHQTASQGSNLFGWWSRKLDDRWGYTVVTGVHRQARVDQDGDGWANLPGVERFEARPRLFYDGRDGTSLFVTGGFTGETRTGGTVEGAKAPDGQPWVETQQTRRGDLGVVAHHLLTPSWLLQLRASANIDDKHKTYGTEPEQLTRRTAFAELSATRGLAHHDLLIGGALQRDDADIVQAPDLGYLFGTASVFAQDAWTITPTLSATFAARVDDHSRYGAMFSPRASLLYRFAPHWGARLSGSRGGYAPTPFTEETDAVGVRRVSGFTTLSAERANNASFDINGSVGSVELNATTFMSTITDPVLAADNPFGASGITLRNVHGTTRTSGAEFFAVYNLAPLYVTFLYAYIDAREPQPLGGGQRVVPRTPRQSGGIDATWESSETGTWIALEGFYTGQQSLDEDPYRTASRPFWNVAFLATQSVGHVKVFLSVENLTNVRQTQWESIWLPARRATGQWTAAPWAPLEGRVVSLGIRLHSPSLRQ